MLCNIHFVHSEQNWQIMLWNLGSDLHDLDTQTYNLNTVLTQSEEVTHTN